MSNLRVELVLENVSHCPIGNLSRTVHEPVTQLSWLLLDYIVTEQSTAMSDTEVAEVAAEGGRHFTAGSENLSREIPRMCSTLDQESDFVSEVYANDGDLHVTLGVGDKQQLRDLVADMEQTHGGVSIKHISEAEDKTRVTDRPRADLRKLTDRQYEVIETAYEMGYFSYPRDSNAGEVADTLGISSSTFTEHLTTAQAKLFDDLFAE